MEGEHAARRGTIRAHVRPERIPSTAIDRLMEQGRKSMATAIEVALTKYAGQ